MTSPSSAICRKELLVALRSRSSWLAAAALACATGALACLFAGGGVPAQALCARLARMLPFCVAFATMGRFAGGRGDGRLESVLSAPVSPAEVVAGQFSAGFLLSLLFLAACAAPSLAAGGAPLLSARSAAPMLAGLAALALATAALAAFGTLSSLACGAEVSSAAVTMLAGSAAVAAALGDLPGFPPAPLSEALDPTRFATGAVDSRFVVLCLSSTALFAFLNVRLLESRAYLIRSRR